MAIKATWNPTSDLKDLWFLKGIAVVEKNLDVELGYWTRGICYDTVLKNQEATSNDNARAVPHDFQLRLGKRDGGPNVIELKSLRVTD
jgi:hypothetical protein